MVRGARRGSVDGGGSGEPPDGPIVGWSATETAAAVASGRVTASEVVAAHLAHLTRTNPDLGAVTRVDAGAEAQAAAVDRRLAEGWTGPLAGVPVTIKDNVDVAGQTTPNGFRRDAEPASDDAPVVAALRDAGAVILGRTNTPEFSWRWHTDNPLFGPTRNPWDPAITPGGSSGGASAALAAGIGCLAVGNDAGGSLRWPAGCTGIAALKPTTGRIASHNRTSPGERPLGIELMAVQGPMARTVADLAPMLDVLARPSWRDPIHVPVPLDHGLDGLRHRVGWSPAAEDGVHPEVAAALDRARGALTEAGWSVVEVELPDLERSARGWATLVNADFHATNRDLMVEVGSGPLRAMLAAFDRAGPPLGSGAGGPGSGVGTGTGPVGAGRDGAVAELYRVLGERSELVRAWQRLLVEEVDAVLLPIAREPAWPSGDDATSPERLDEIFAANTPLVAVNHLGLPAAAVATSLAGRRPCGVQLVARRFAEAMALAAAAAIEGVLGPLRLPELPGR